MQGHNKTADIIVTMLYSQAHMHMPQTRYLLHIREELNIHSRKYDSANVVVMLYVRQILVIPDLQRTS